MRSPKPALISSLLFLTIPVTAVNALAEEASPTHSDPSNAEFELLSEGDDLSGWKHQGNWTIHDGVISREGPGGSLVFVDRAVPDDFELRFDWKVAEGSNSGVYYRPTQYEYQILDNQKHRDGTNPRTSAASLYFCVQPSRDATKPVGQWNQGRIVCKGSVIQHWLNGEKVVHMDYRDPKWRFHVNLLEQRGGNLEARGANLSLQDHGDPVWYRNIRLRNLRESDPIDLAPVVPAPISEEVRASEQKKLEGILQRRRQAKAKP
ncbi:MAG: DUF1080 domain-containing protein [Planctomycetota bacterium]|nr:DUF1080 domain-containing protein [Planctomycetota bacterium]